VRNGAKHACKSVSRPQAAAVSIVALRAVDARINGALSAVTWLAAAEQWHRAASMQHSGRYEEMRKGDMYGVIMNNQGKSGGVGIKGRAGRHSITPLVRGVPYRENDDYRAAIFAACCVRRHSRC